MTLVKEVTNNNKEHLSNEAIKEALYQELELKLDLGIHGVNFDPEELKPFSKGPGRSSPFGGNAAYPTAFRFLNGKLSGANSEGGLRWDPSSAYGLVVEDGKPVIYKYGPKTVKIGEIEFRERRPHHPLLDKTTSDGIPFHTIASVSEAGQVHVNYSQECVLKDKGEDCYFCNYSVRNATIKTPQQVGEVFSTLYKAGIGKHLNLTSGFMHERRELEYYLDVAEEIKKRTGLKEFRATAVIGAPVDLSAIEKYKEAGFFSIRMNIEIWDKNIWRAICPGKHNHCGGWDNWVKALEHAVEVFGKGKVASNIVGGIEPKKSILEGVEYKVSRGIIASASTWRPVAGSFLEGHRSPETAWHFDLQRKIAALYKKYGFTFADLHNVSPTAGLAVTIFQIEEEDFENSTLRPWKYPQQITTIIKEDKAMSDKKLENEVIDYIANAKLAIIATITDENIPALRTIGSFAHDGLTIYFSTGKDTEKVKQIEKNQNVVVFIQHEGQERGKFRNVTITGIARLLTDKNSIDQAVSILSNKNPNFKQRIEKGEISKIAIIKIEPKSIKDLDFSRGNGTQAVQTILL